MKLLYSLSFFFLVFEMQPIAAQNEDLSKLAEKKRYTELQKRLEAKGLDRKTKDIYQSILFNVFGKPASSNKIIDELLNGKYRLSDSTKFMLLETRHDNFTKLFNYSKAYEAKQFLLDNYASFYPKEKLEDEMEVLYLLKALKDEPPQEISMHGRTEVPVTRNFMGLQKIPIQVNDSSYSFIFDTGAGFSTVTDSIAGVLKLRILDKVPVVVKGGITGLGTKIRLGIAENLSIGKIEIRNVVFLVFPDSTLTFNTGEMQFKIDAIIGFPVIKELGAITFYEDKLGVNEAGSEKEYRSNMAIDYLKPILYLNYKGEDLPFTFDTGADQSVLTEVFYNRYKIMVDRQGESKTESYGGAGGIKEFKVRVLPSVQFNSLGDMITLKNISVSTEKISTGNGVYYGNLGQDLVKQFRSMTINFRRSWIKFNN